MKKYLNIFKMIHNLSPAALPFIFLKSLTSVLSPYLMLLFTAIILDGFLAKMAIEVLVTYVLVFLVVQLVINLSDSFFSMKTEYYNLQLSLRLNDALTKQSLNIEYLELSNPDTRLLFQRAEEGSNSTGGIHAFAQNVIGEICKLSIAFLISGSALLSLVLAQSSVNSSLAVFANSWLFGFVIAVLIVIPVVSSLVFSLISAGIRFKMFTDITTVNREMSYYGRTIFVDVNAGKTLRLYGASKMVMGVFLDRTVYFINEFKRVILKTTNIDSVGTIITFLCVAFLYLLVGLKAELGVIGVGAVVMYVGYVQTLVSSLVFGMANLGNASMIVSYLNYYYDYLNLPLMTSGTVGVEIEDDYVFEFKDVSFSYPGSDKPVLDKVNLIIEPKQRLAVVGRNGAGKTTFIKLLTRLYQPTSGVILCNGVDINTLTTDSYYELLAVVFQDFSMYPFTIEENIALSLNVDERRVAKSLELVDIKSEIDQLPLGMKTPLKGQLDEGVSLSGGQFQKLAIARAWYKDASLVILDEPTAALDPISESEIYKHFNEIMDNKSAIFVSHRMSSCQFCDRIVVFDKGRIVEDGSHKDLMMNRSGLYFSLFDAQAQYYQ